MLLKCRELMDGVGPSEVVVEVASVSGPEEVVVQKSSLKGGALEVGSILGQRDGTVLVELPRESASGKWRVWVSRSEVLQTA